MELTIFFQLKTEMDRFFHYFIRRLIPQSVSLASATVISLIEHTRTRTHTHAHTHTLPTHTLSPNLSVCYFSVNELLLEHCSDLSPAKHPSLSFFFKLIRRCVRKWESMPGMREREREREKGREGGREN